ncbi:hypothetical protein [Paenibacillus sp. A14]|uniref:hypothetical protein n=1 Tax=Paenibacillus sp. A14 TaxID=3119820 RepID=UPI002FE3D0C5
MIEIRKPLIFGKLEELAFFQILPETNRSLSGQISHLNQTSAKFKIQAVFWGCAVLIN